MNFSYHGYYFWIPIVSPFIGALVGAWTYLFMVGFHVKEDREKVQVQYGKAAELERLT